jgi:putative DNA primase/helicase
MTAGEFRDHFKKVSPTAKPGKWSALCPAHDDHVPSLEISHAEKRSFVKCFVGCDEAAILAAAGLTTEDVWYAPKPTKAPKALTIEALAAAKGFSVEFLKSLGVAQSGDSVKITHHLKDGSPADRHQLRHAGHPRFTWTKGPGEIGPYGLDRLAAAKAEQYLVLVEGASDCWSGWLHGIPTLGIPGADMAKVLLLEHLAGIEKVYVLHEPDDGGHTFVSRIAARLQMIGYTGNAYEFQTPEGRKDLNELHLAKTPEQFHDLFQNAIDIAPPLPPPVEIGAPALSAATYARTPFGNMERLLNAYADDILYSTGIGWLEWDGKRWARDPEELRLQLRAEAVVKTLIAEANAVPMDVPLFKWSQSCQSRAAVQEMVDLAQKHVHGAAETLDASRTLFNVQNGTIDLGSDHLREHRREDRLTHISPVTFDAHALAPTWIKFLDAIMCHRPDLVGYLQRLVGYCLTGEVTEQCFFIWHGLGANGKSTLLEIIRALLGYDYAKQTPAATFLQKKDTGSAPSPEIARLKGCRLVTAVETDRGRRLSEALVKSATGGDRQVGRYLYQDLIEYDPTYKIIIAANHKPKVHGTDYAIWRRIQLLPFEATFKGVDDDRDMKKKLLAELPGILRWAVEGARLWTEHGLNPPDEVKMATETYRQDEDRLGEFFTGRCVIQPDLKATSADLLNAYRDFCAEASEEPMSANDFAKELQDRGLTKATFGHKKTRGWLGIGLLDADSGHLRTPFSGTQNAVEEATPFIHPGVKGSTPERFNFLETPSAVPALSAPHRTMEPKGISFPAVEVPVSRVQSAPSAPRRKMDTSFNAYWPMIAVLDRLHVKAACTTPECPLHAAVPLQAPPPRRRLRRADDPEMVERLARAFPEGRPLPLPDSAEEPIINIAIDPVPAPQSRRCASHPITPRMDICAGCREALWRRRRQP